MLRQVRNEIYIYIRYHLHARTLTHPPLFFSYDLDMDTRLAEETTTLVESYTVSSQATFCSPLIAR